MALTIQDLLDKLADFRQFAGQAGITVPVVVESSKGGARTTASGVYIDGSVNDEGEQQYNIVVRLYVLPDRYSVSK